MMEFLDILEQVKNERFRQINEEGWSCAHDDTHIHGELAFAAAAYTLEANSYIPPTEYPDLITSNIWPWDMKWWKPKTPRRDLIRAAALIVAEIERLDRSAKQR